MHFSIYCGLILLVASATFAVPVKSANACGYASCKLGDPTKINIHLVPHTHDDVGWLKTVDQYYYGAREDIQIAGVQHILDSVILALDENPDRRFIYVEIAFFWRWWIQQDDNMHNKVRQFVNEGRLEFISGGWCMNDEASTHYNSIIDQHTLGAQFLRDQFGECGRPKLGWQIDPFGHSREFASLIAQMGFDGLFFGRADYQDINARNSTKTKEMVWKASANLGTDAYLFTGILPNGYGPPDSFCYDIFCADPPIMDDPRLHDYNVDERVKTFIQAAHNEAVGYATNQIIMTMGSDFQYENANEWFKNMDKLIRYVNAQQANGSNVNVFYSTPSCYLYALNNASRTWTSKSDDFFPYAHHPHGFWTGYFTSRAALKRYERHANNILQVTRQLNALANTQQGDNIFYLSEAMGVAQHHDAVSGTEKQEVAFDYAQRLSDGIDAALGVNNLALAKLLPRPGQTAQAPKQFFCQLGNISSCLAIESQNQFTVTLWNPTGHAILQHFRVPVSRNYTVRDPTGQPILAEPIAVSDQTKKIPGRNSTATYDLLFRVNLPPLGFNTYFFQAKAGEEEENQKEPKLTITTNDECALQNQNLRVEIDAQGNLQHIVNLQKQFDVQFSSQGFYWYQGFQGNNSKSEFQPSGAYIFRPLSQTPQPVSTSRTITCIKGEHYQKAIIVFNEWASQEITLYDEGTGVEVEWTVGPIPVDDKIGREVVMRYDTDIASAGKFYTDANGREVLERTRDYRPTWNYTVFEPVSGNYYPVNSRIWIKDANRQLTVLTDRSHGGSSIKDGSIEVMLHRRTINDDSLGVGEPLSETAFGTGLVVRGRHSLVVQPPETSAQYHRVAAQQMFMHPLAFYSIPTESYTDYSTHFRQTWSALATPLPVNVHLLTLDQVDAKNYIVRLEHFFELNEDATYSHPVTVDLQTVFQAIGTISTTVEYNLSANIPLSEVKRLNWVTSDGESSQTDVPRENELKDTNISLNPMQIRTFKVTIN